MYCMGLIHTRRMHTGMYTHIKTYRQRRRDYKDYKKVHRHIRTYRETEYMYIFNTFNTDQAFWLVRSLCPSWCSFCPTQSDHSKDMTSHHASAYPDNFADKPPSKVIESHVYVNGVLDHMARANCSPTCQHELGHRRTRSNCTPQMHSLTQTLLVFRCHGIASTIVLGNFHIL